jgi:uncharacterized protein YjdB
MIKLRSSQRALRLTAVSALVLVAGCRDRVVDPGTPPVVPVASINVVPASLNLPAGQQAPLVAEARDAAGSLLTGASITWRSDAPEVATVDHTGMVRALAPGRAHHRQCHKQQHR